MPVEFQLSCVMFDLDGTLVDSAPDLIAALNKARQHRGLDPVSTAEITPFISYGAAAMIRKSLNGFENETLLEKILKDMLDEYQVHIADRTRLFEGMPGILDSIEAKGLKWGVITNKRERFTTPLMDALGLIDRAACIVSGDTTANNKPHPEPMLTACQQAGVTASECLYIGDSAHDIEAGKRTNMKTLAAVYGYLKPDDRPKTWGADALINHPAEISTWIDSCTCH